ncbi:uncharacterized protein LOC129296259 isoform X2 [Prosopis cineraria]|uniref:uncharacterized protein LOC129295950 isoform X2 n=1 Tax=Prosopis cineraria TaxID=364024 RepID=UPI00240EE5D1|nr:uncharacterized protein LOC129295950 isoform X2 [Prosopis cineraria]XP_054790524.1 uncharacterized protein LOC129295951 isoform X2 [Prosopis cineraria]XP_054790823.1 uncharacterized protein LOC129296259 isoform X2 [Prosopis cineraria]
MNKPLIVEQFLTISLILSTPFLGKVVAFIEGIPWCLNNNISNVISEFFCFPLVHTLMMESFINLGRSMSSCSFLCVPRLASVAAGWIACAVFIEKCFNEWVLQPPFQAVFFLASDCVDARILGT